MTNVYEHRGLNWSYLEKLPIPKPETYCSHYPKRLGVNSLGVPLQCSNRISLTKSVCAECEAEINSPTETSKETK